MARREKYLQTKQPWRKCQSGLLSPLHRDAVRSLEREPSIACSGNINISTFQSLPHFILWFYDVPSPTAVPGYRHLNWTDRVVMGTTRQHNKVVPKPSLFFLSSPLLAGGWVWYRPIISVAGQVPAAGLGQAERARAEGRN